MSQVFKGIALFTPGGDLIYCIDSSKRSRWHIHLCFGLQDLFGLPEPPHFLVPGYTATIDRWLDPHTQKIQTIAEIYPPVERYRALLNEVFGLDRIDWQTVTWQEQYCNPTIIETYRDRYPVLWENNDSIVRLDWQTRSDRPLTQVTPTGEIVAGEEAYLEPDSPFAEVVRPPTFSNATQHLERQLSSTELLTSIPTKNVEISNAYVLRLFVSGDNYALERTLVGIHQLLEKGLGHPYTLKVIDIGKNPELAEGDRVSATPALIRIWPKPVRRIVGDLNDFHRVLQILTSF